MAFLGLNEETLQKIAAESGAGSPASGDPVKVESEVNAVDNTGGAGDGSIDIDLVDLDSDTGAGAGAGAEGDSGDSGASTDADDSTDLPDINDDAAVNTVLTTAGLNPDDVKARIIKDGGITDEYVAELKEKLDPAIVDAYVTSFKTKVDAAKAEAAANETKPNAELAAANKVRKELNDFIYGSVGGEDKFSVMSTVLKSNLPQETIDVINAKLRSDSKALIKEGLSEAVAAYKKATGRGKVSMEGDQGSQAAEQFVFMTKSDYHKVITTEKYKTDSAYAAKVDAQRMKSKEMDNAALLPGQFRNIRNGRMYRV